VPGGAAPSLLHAARRGLIAAGALASAGLFAAAVPALAQAPLSAIDWLSDAPLAPPTPAALLPVTPPDAQGPAEISMRPLDRVPPEAVGLYPASRVGLPRGIWGPSTGPEIAALLAILPSDTLPALRDLTLRLLLAEFDPPAPGATTDPEAFVAARIEALVRMGALDQAGALLDTLDPASPRLAALKFDLRLLLGDDDAACEGLARVVQAGGAQAAATGNLPAAAVFCQARGGDWEGAERSLAEVRAGQGALAPDYLDLLDRFVDFDAHSDAGPLVMPASPSPLAWRLLEALGEPVATQGLPLAFAHADLRGTAGWRAQIEAAERLVRAGALPPNRLIGLYTERRAAASGGIWERVRRVQALDAALAAGERGAIATALAAAWPQVQEGELEVPFANLFARPLMAARLTGPDADLAAIVGLLSEDYELAALGIDAAAPSPRLARLAAIARGLPPPGARAEGADAEGAVLAVFANPEPLPQTVADRLAQGRIGEELLRALIRIGASNDPRMLAEGLTLLRHLGLEDIARRTALQALLLDRRG
jgi:hypothetical protein